MNNVVSVDIDELGPVLNRIKVDCDDIVEICKTAKAKIESISAQSSVPTAATDKIADKLDQLVPQLSSMSENVSDMLRTLEQKAAELEDADAEALRNLDEI